MRGPGEILVVSCYELGRQPVAVAVALGELERAGFRPAAQDVSIDRLDAEALRRARLVAISVPMHTALRLGVAVAARARELSPSAQVAFFGLYATLNEAHLLARHADSVAGDERGVVALAQALERGATARTVDRGATARTVDRTLSRSSPLPSRGALPLLSRYAQLDTGAGRRIVGTVEATRGCKHLCRHCPIVPVFRGRFFAIDRDVVLADIAQQIDAGASHITFGDPDFLNGPTHALKLARAFHARWPHATFDATIKIEHLLAHRELLPELASCGCLFITSAVESLNDRVLAALDKGHRAADVAVALRLVRAAGMQLHPTFLPYTPWTELGDAAALLDFAAEHELELEPVQMTLRLLIPPGSAILDVAGPWLGPLVPEAFGHVWTHEDPRIDALWRESAALVKRAAEAGVEARVTLAALHQLALRAAGRAPQTAALRGPRKRGPRLTEPWFC